MASFNFYHLTKSTFEEALPKLMEKMLGAKQGNAVMIFNNEPMLKRIDEVLWSVGGTRFIPHGTEKEDFKDKQPIYLTQAEENPNQAKFLIHIGSAANENFYNKFEKNIIIFSNNDEKELAEARNMWKKLKSDANFDLKYYMQDETGNWAEKG